MTMTNKAKLCYDCGMPKPTHEELKAGAAKHVCVPRNEPEPGTTFELERYTPDPFFGSYGVDIKDKDGKTIVGTMHDRSTCERLLRIRGWKGPFNWPTVAESMASSDAKRAAARLTRTAVAQSTIAKARKGGK